MSPRNRSRFILSILLALTTVPLGARAEENQPTTTPRHSATIEVTATRVPEILEPVPISVTVLSGDDLRARGATDLSSALALVSGVSIAPGGDGGPASSVPEMWGLREFDAFLLVVDGVPWGGAFNPALASLDLGNIERIEIVRGSAPVMYGATSFVGVIHVIHRDPGQFTPSVALSAGNYGSGSAAASSALPSSGAWKHAITVDGQKQGFRDDRTSFDRGHALYRGVAETASGRFRLDVDATILTQDPASPHPRTGATLTSLVPLDANLNPADAKFDENRFHVVFGNERKIAIGKWSTTLAFTQSTGDIIRGFLSDVTTDVPNARGYRQHRTTDDVYFDSHLVHRWGETAQLVAGVDHLYGRGTADSATFSYFAPLDGQGLPSSVNLPIDEETGIRDTRNFSGLYAQIEWHPSVRWRFDAGARLNRTDETRTAGDADELGDLPQNRRTVNRGSGSLGASWLAWQSGPSATWVYANYRNTYKPAAIDFGPEAEGDILEPETGASWELGLRGTSFGERLDWQLSGFTMDLENLVVSQIVNGLPGLVNAGTERFQGAELEAGLLVTPALRWRVAYSYHDARFRDYVQLFDGVPAQLRGNRLEMSPTHLAATGIVWLPARGWNANATVNYVGSRYLNKRNSAIAPEYVTWSAGLGYRFDRYEIRLKGENLSDQRPPVAESELGDAQYYRLPARSVRVTGTWRF